MDYHIAQINIARMLAPLDTLQMADFVANLDRINALAEGSPGFIWRLKGEGNDATTLRPFPDDWLIVNMSVWETIEALHQYTYYSAHVEIFRRRGEWFSKLGTPAMVLWWIPAGHIPDLAEAKAKLEMLEKQEATPQAFTFKQRFTVEEMASFAT